MIPFVTIPAANDGYIFPLGRQGECDLIYGREPLVEILVDESDAHVLTLNHFIHRAARMNPATRSSSTSVNAVPLGRHKPSLKIPSDTDPPLTLQPLKTGCRCIGFHSGRDSMFSFSSASRISSLVEPNRAGSTRMQVSQ